MNGFGYICNDAITTAGLNLNLLYVQQSDTAPFCENYAKLYSNAKHLEKGLNRG